MFARNMCALITYAVAFPEKRRVYFCKVVIVLRRFCQKEQLPECF